MTERQGLHARSARLFSIHYGHAKVTYEELLIRAGQLPRSPANETTAAAALERPYHPLVSFLTTFSAASITFMVAAHFASVAPASLRALLAL